MTVQGRKTTGQIVMVVEGQNAGMGIEAEGAQGAGEPREFGENVLRVGALGDGVTERTDT